MASSPPAEPEEVSRSFAAFLDWVLPIEGDALDAGTGRGRVAFVMAPRARRIVAVDRDGAAIQAAQEEAGRRGLRNVKFCVADAEQVRLVDLNDGTPYLLATAHLFLSLPLLSRLREALAPGGSIVARGFAADHWKEAGGSRFNLEEADVRQALSFQSFFVRRWENERQARNFASEADARTFLRDRSLLGRWEADGRWERWRQRSEGSRFSLTESFLTFWARGPG